LEQNFKSQKNWSKGNLDRFWGKPGAALCSFARLDQANQYLYLSFLEKTGLWR